MNWSTARLDALEIRVFGRTTNALDALARLLGRDASFSQALTYIIEEIAEGEYERSSSVKGAAERTAQILRIVLGVRIVIENALDHITILYAPEGGEKNELPLCDLSVNNGLIWRSVDS